MLIRFRQQFSAPFPLPCSHPEFKLFSLSGPWKSNFVCHPFQAVLHRILGTPGYITISFFNPWKIFIDILNRFFDSSHREKLRFLWILTFVMKNPGNVVTKRCLISVSIIWSNCFVTALFHLVTQWLHWSVFNVTSCIWDDCPSPPV